MTSTQPIGNASGNPFRQWLGFLASYVLFILLPLALAWSLSETYFLQEQNHQDQKLLRSSRHYLEKVAGLTEISFQLQKKFRHLRDRFIQRRINPQQWPVIMEQLRRQFGFNVDLYLFSAEGSLVTPSCLQVQHRAFMQEFWGVLSSDRKNLSEDNARLASRIFGNDWTDVQAKRGLTTTFHNGDGEGYMFWDYDPLTVSGGIAFFIWEKPDPLRILRARFPNSLGTSSFVLFAQTPDSTTHPIHGCGFFDAESGNASPSFRQTPSSLDLVSSLYKRSGSTLLRFRGKTWTAFSTKGHVFYLGVTEKNQGALSGDYCVRALICLFALFGFIVGHRWIIRKEDAYLSIRFKLIALFLYALMVPFMGILTLSRQTFQETARVLEDEAIKEGVAIAKKVDDDFCDEPERLRKRYVEYFRRFDNSDAQNHFPQVMNRLLWSEDFRTVELRDETGETFQNLGSSSSSEEMIRRLLRHLVRKAIVRYLPERRLSKEGNDQEGVSDLFISSMVETTDLGFDQILDFPNRVRQVLLPSHDMFFYWNYYSDPRLPAPLFFGSIFTSDAKDRYLKRSILSWKSPPGTTGRLFAFDQSGFFAVPASGWHSSALRQISQKVRLTGKVQTGHMYWNSEPWIAIGYPGRQIPEFNYIVLLPETRVSGPLQALFRNIVAGLASILFLTFLLGWMLANTFLKPIGDLGHGIQAIREKDPRFRLTSFPKDEFGDLSRAFNEMMVNLDELNAGKLVQEQLFPKGSLRVGDYLVGGLSLPATHLGGDYFDYVQVGNDRLLVLLGDVSGHGLPAALIMAVSKAIVSAFPQGEIDPDALIETLNRAIHSVMGGRRVMTMSLLWIDTCTHRVTYFHMGHTFPISWHRDGTTEFLKGKGKPVGMRGTLKTFPLSLSIEPGDRILLYTDGLVESLETDATRDSFATFQHYVAEQPWLPLPDACEALIKNHPFFKSGAIQPDDFSAVLLERLPALDINVLNKPQTTAFK